VSCDGQNCPTTDEFVCCFREMSFSCEPEGSCMGHAIYCDGPEDCLAGEVCCLTAQAGAAISECKPDGDCLFERLCSSNQDCPEGMSCCFTTLGAYADYTIHVCLLQACD
jgi:hypothetical protein